jgi:hypothetical protein
MDARWLEEFLGYNPRWRLGIFGTCLQMGVEEQNTRLKHFCQDHSSMLRWTDPVIQVVLSEELRERSRMQNQTSSDGEKQDGDSLQFDPQERQYLYQQQQQHEDPVREARPTPQAAPPQQTWEQTRATKIKTSKK